MLTIEGFHREGHICTHNDQIYWHDTLQCCISCFWEVLVCAWILSLSVVKNGILLKLTALLHDSNHLISSTTEIKYAVCTLIVQLICINTTIYTHIHVS